MICWILPQSSDVRVPVTACEENEPDEHQSTCIPDRDVRTSGAGTVSDSLLLSECFEMRYDAISQKSFFQIVRVNRPLESRGGVPFLTVLRWWSVRPCRYLEVFLSYSFCECRDPLARDTRSAKDV